MPRSSQDHGRKPWHDQISELESCRIGKSRANPSPTVRVMKQFSFAAWPLILAPSRMDGLCVSIKLLLARPISGHKFTGCEKLLRKRWVSLQACVSDL